MTITLELPYPVSLNAMYRTFRGRMLISEKGREYIQTVGWCIKMAPDSPRAALTGRLRVGIEAWMPDARTRDLDNTMKAVLDSCTKAGLWASDGQIDHLCVQRMPIVKLGKLIMTIEELPSHRLETP